jgi:hypothetical protein
MSGYSTVRVYGPVEMKRYCMHKLPDADAWGVDVIVETYSNPLVHGACVIIQDTVYVLYNINIYVIFMLLHIFYTHSAQDKYIMYDVCNVTLCGYMRGK